MIKSFIFDNFKSFDKAVLNIEKITTLIGTNASGKSNAIEGIQILSELSFGREVSLILEGTKNAESTIRGGAKGCCRFRSSSFSLGCVVDLNDNSDLLYRIKIEVGSRICIIDESLYIVANGSTNASNGKLIFKTKDNKSGDSGDIWAEYNNGKRGPNPELSVIRTMSVLSQIISKIPSDIVIYDDIVHAISIVRNNLKQIFILDPSPAAMRDYSRIGDATLRRNCSNISSVLFDLQKSSGYWNILTEIVQSLPEHEIRGIDFVKTTIQDVVFVLKEESGKSYESIEAGRLSDGTLRCIAAITALMSEPENSLVIIEEVDNGIHPSRAKHLLDALIKLSDIRHIDLMFTTHNVSLLNALPKEGILGVSVAYRDLENKAGKFIPFVDIKNYPGLLAIGGIGNALEKESILHAIKDSSPDGPFLF